MDSWSHPAFRPSEGPTMTTRDCTNTEESDLYTRTSWVDARVAYKEIKKGKATGNECALYLRWHLQKHLYNLGNFIQRHSGKVLFVGLLLLSLCCVGLKTATVETNVEKLWVEEGGRLEKELQYIRKTLGEGSGTTSEIIIQTPKRGVNVLSQESLSLHYQALLAATRVHVDMFDITWKLSDICYKPSFPRFDSSLMDQLLEKLVPCFIITPLDCFWEGSKVLGPEHPILVPGYSSNVRWSNLNPKQLVESLKNLGFNFPTESIQELLTRAGITSGYQEKACINPHDMECPITASNYQTKQVPDFGAELTGGCTGFATKYMQWPEDLIVGGVHKNKTGHIVRAEAMQSIVQLMGEKQMYEFHESTYKTHSIDWTPDTAKRVLETWQRKFTAEVARILNNSNPKQDDLHAFSSTSLLDILKEFSAVSTIRVSLGYLLMLFYACISLLRWTDAIQSQSGVGIAGVLLVALSVGAGLGICSVFGLHFNAATTQIIPFLALGIGVDDMFLIAHTFAENANKPEIAYMDQTAECLKRTGVSVLLTSLSNICAFFMAAIIPIPALRAFSLQAAILVIFNLGTILLVFPALVSLDLIRREEKRVDVFCCFTGSSANRVIELQPRSRTPPPEYSREPSPPPSYNNVMMHQAVTQTNSDGSHPVTMLANENGGGGGGAPTRQHHQPQQQQRSASLNSVCPNSTASSRQCLTPEDGPTCKDRCVQTQRECCSFSLTWFAKRFYGPALQKTPVKVLVIVLFSALLGFGVFGTVKVKDGLDLTDIVPRDTNEFNFLASQSKYFGFYNMYAVTKSGFDYPDNQQILHDYHKEFLRVEQIIKKEDGSLPDFWLQLFREWLRDLQRAFDTHWSTGCITMERWCHNATDDAILGYKLMVQTGDIDEPVDKNRLLERVRLVDDEGIINPSGFYNYLTAWTSNDALAYASSAASFYPLPKEWIHVAQEHELKIPKSQPLVFAQMPFYLNNLGETETITDTIEQVRGISEKYIEKGLPNFPSGIPFTFWEQYINLRFYLMLSLMCVLGGIFIVITILLMNPWAATVVVAVLAMVVIELFGFMGLAGIKLSAVPAVILIVSVGIGVEFTVHICLGFLTAIGSRNRRMQMTLEHMFAPVIHGAMSTLLGVIMLVGSEFDFIVRYFFNVLTALVVLGVLNGLVLLPVLLSMLGPTSEVVPRDDPDRIATPTPEPSPKLPERPLRSISRRVYPRMPSDISLTTITEEPTQYSSHEIIVQPEVTVEVAGPGAYYSSSRNNSPPSSTQSTPPLRHSMTVKAKAHVTVEVHTQLPGTVEQSHSYKSKRRKMKEQETFNSDSDSSGKS